MYDYTRANPSAVVTAERGSVMGKVLALLGFAFLFTAGGAVVGPSLGPGAIWLSLLGTFGSLIALIFLREKAPINLILLYTFAFAEGLLLGLVLDAYLARGLGGIVLTAAGATAAITVVAGVYGATTKRDLSGLGRILFIGLLAVVVAAVIGFFVQLPFLAVGIAAVSAVLFTGFIVYDLNQVANAHGATEGQVIWLTVGVYLDIFNLFLALLRLLTFFASDD